MFVSNLIKRLPDLAPSVEWDNRVTERVQEFLHFDFSGSESFKSKGNAAKEAVARMLQKPEAWMTAGEGSHQSPFQTAAVFYKEVQRRGQETKTKLRTQNSSKHNAGKSQTLAAEYEQLQLAEQSIRQIIVHIGAWNLRQQLVDYLSDIEKSGAYWEEPVAGEMAFRAAQYIRRCRLGQQRKLSIFPTALDNLIPRVDSKVRIEILKRAKEIVGLLAEFEPDAQNLPPEMSIRMLSIRPLQSSISLLHNED